MNSTAQKQEVATQDDVRDPFVDMVERLAKIPDLNPDTVQKFLDMQMQIMDRNAKTEFYDAMNRVQSKLPSVLPDSRNTQTSSDYASLKAISAAITPVYTAEGFSTSFWQGESEKPELIRVEGVLRHKAGHSEPVRHVEFPPDKVGIKGTVNKTDIHAAGSAFTYGRRYLKCMMFDVAVGHDTDGNAPENGLTEEQALNIQAMLDELSEEKQAAFFKKSRKETIDDLLAERYPVYVKWLEKQRAEA
jgi:hypothetical protein